MSADNWGHIERGYQSTGAGRPPRIVTPPAATLAHMARAVSISPEELEEIGRSDAAKALRDLLRVSVPPVAAAVPTPATSSSELARHLLNELRSKAQAESRTLAEVLVTEGLAEPDELVVPDSLAPDPIIKEINAADMSQEVKDHLIRIHLDNRRRRFEDTRLKRTKPDDR